MQTVLKRVGTSGQLTLGKRFAGKHFEIEERSSGELLLRPVRLVADTSPAAKRGRSRLPAFQIAEVEQVIIPGREQRNARRN